MGNLPTPAQRLLLRALYRPAKTLGISDTNFLKVVYFFSKNVIFCVSIAEEVCGYKYPHSKILFFNYCDKKPKLK